MMNPVMNLVKNRNGLRASGDLIPEPEPVLRTAEDKKVYMAILASGTRYQADGTYMAPNGAIVVPLMAGSEILLADKANNLVYDLNGYIVEKRSDGTVVREKLAWKPGATAPMLSSTPALDTKNGLAKTPVTTDLVDVPTGNAPAQTVVQPTSSWKDKLPSWALPAAIGVGGLAVGGGVAYWVMKSKKRR